MDKQTDLDPVYKAVFYQRYVSFFFFFFQNYLTYLDYFPRPYANVCNPTIRIQLVKMDSS